MHILSNVICVLLALSSAVAQAENWPSWRGPRGDGTSLETNLPLHWSSTSNVIWKTEIPGEGHASPIVWENKVFTVTALPDTLERVLVCLDRSSGKILWQQTVVKVALEAKNQLNSYASSTPATDGELVYVAFLDDKEMLVAAYDFTGRQRWCVHPGVFSSKHGFCSSPMLFRDKVIVNGDHDGDSYLVAVSRADGKTIWKTPRENHTRSYCTPYIKELAGRWQMILSGDKCVASYDPDNGKRHWVIDGPTEQFVASLVYNERADLLFMTGGFPDHHNLAFKPDGLGNVTQTKIAWRTTKGVAYVPSPISFGDYFLVVSDSGEAHCFDAKTGNLQWKERLGEHHACPVSGDGRIYFLNDRGVMNVIIPGSTCEKVAQNKLEERCYASPAISQGQIFLRTFTQLYCIGQKP
jgi:outer membrane protein assembly factor BamB